MDMGLQGRTALVCAASKGLGRACAMALAREGVAVTITARTPGPLEEAAMASNCLASRATSAGASVERPRVRQMAGRADSHASPASRPRRGSA